MTIPPLLARARGRQGGDAYSGPTISSLRLGTRNGKGKADNGQAGDALASACGIGHRAWELHLCQARTPRDGVSLMRAVLLTLAVAATVSASTRIVGPAEAPTPIPQNYLAWFSDVAKCVGKPDFATPARFDRIDWHISDRIVGKGGEEALGKWTGDHRITIRSDMSQAQWVVKHEMVHDILNTTAHESPFFDECVHAQAPVTRSAHWEKTAD